MCKVLAPAPLDSERPPVSMRSRDVLAVVWAQDDEQAEAAIEMLRHALWPYYFLFQIVEIRQLPRSERCPLRDCVPVQASMLRDRWAWVLVPLGTDPSAVAS